MEERTARSTAVAISVTVPTYTQHHSTVVVALTSTNFATFCRTVLHRSFSRSYRTQYDRLLASLSYLCLSVCLVTLSVTLCHVAK